MVSRDSPPQCKADECYPEVTLRAPLLAHAACLNERAVCLRTDVEAPVFCELLRCLQGSCKDNISRNEYYASSCLMLLYDVLALLTQESHPSDNEHEMEQA